MNVVTVLRKALEMYEADGEHFDCLYCAISRAKTELSADDPLTVEQLRQFLQRDVIELHSDRPLVEAREALAPFRDEIKNCPSPMTQNRCMDVLRSTLAQLEAVQGDMIEPPQVITETIVKQKTNPEWLKWKRRRAGVSQYYMAVNAGCSESHISNIECGFSACPAHILALYKEL